VRGRKKRWSMKRRKRRMRKGGRDVEGEENTL
jgi:hypothetical protein